LEYTGPEPYESTDIKILRLEIDAAALDLKKMIELVSSKYISSSAPPQSYYYWFAAN